MKYITNKEKVAAFITEQIIPYLINNTKDLDYEQTINAICSETHSSRIIAEEILKSFFPHKIKEIHILTIPDENVKTWLEEMQKKENLINKDLTEAGL